MRIKYFEDTDTLLISLSEHPVFDQMDVGEDILLELDEQGKIVAMTVEHAKSQTDIETLLFQTIPASSSISADVLRR